MEDIYVIISKEIAWVREIIERSYLIWKSVFLSGYGSPEETVYFRLFNIAVDYNCSMFVNEPDEYMCGRGCPFSNTGSLFCGFGVNWKDTGKNMRHLAAYAASRIRRVIREEYPDSEVLE